MEMINECKKDIDSALEQLNKYIEEHRDELGYREQFLQTRSIVSAVLADKDKNLDKILEQQNQIKLLIEIDRRIQNTRKSNRLDRQTIEQLRRECSRISIDAVKEKQELEEDQSKEIERYHMQQLRSIVDDYQRHEKILDQRKTEVNNLKKQIESEGKNREAVLKSLKDNLERSLNTRIEQRLDSNGASCSSRPVEGRLFNSDHLKDNYIELASFEEFNPPDLNNSSQSARRQSNYKARRSRGRGGRRRGNA